LMSVCLLLSCRDLYDGPIPRPEESNWLVRHYVWYRNLKYESAVAELACCATGKESNMTNEYIGYELLVAEICLIRHFFSVLLVAFH
jgi:hypothetical protein